MHLRYCGQQYLQLTLFIGKEQNHINSIFLIGLLLKLILKIKGCKYVCQHPLCETVSYIASCHTFTLIENRWGLTDLNTDGRIVHWCFLVSEVNSWTLSPNEKNPGPLHRNLLQVLKDRAEDERLFKRAFVCQTLMTGLCTHDRVQTDIQ